MKKLLFIILLFCNIFNAGCQKPSDYIEKLNKLEYRDSLSIAHLIKTWENENFSFFNTGHDAPHNIPLDKKIDVLVLNGFYSPDRLKIVSWIAEKIPNNDDFKTDSGYYYCSTGIVGIRDDTNKIFKYMIFDEQICVEASALQSICDCMSGYYFRDMKYDYTYIYSKYYNPYYGGELKEKKDLNFNGPILQQYGYNLQEPEFWEKNLIWYKGARIKGYDNLELYFSMATELDLHGSDSNRIFENYPKINYPDSILKLYPGSYNELHQKNDAIKPKR